MLTMQRLYSIECEELSLLSASLVDLIEIDKWEALLDTPHTSSPLEASTSNSVPASTFQSRHHGDLILKYHQLPRSGVCYL